MCRRCAKVNEFIGVGLGVKQHRSKTAFSVDQFPAPIEDHEKPGVFGLDIQIAGSGKRHGGIIVFRKHRLPPRRVFAMEEGRQIMALKDMIGRRGPHGRNKGGGKVDGFDQSIRCGAARGISLGARVIDDKRDTHRRIVEKIFLAHFEGGAGLGEKLAPGEAKFLPKSEEAWAEFFQRFLPFTQEKKGKVSDLEALVFRGILKKAGAQGEKGVLISDLKFLGGKSDKFARLDLSAFKGVPASVIVEKLASLVPGDLLAQAVLAEWIAGPEFAYQSLSHRVVNPETMTLFRSAIAEAYRSPEEARREAFKGAPEPTRGIAMSARTEQFVAERLGLGTLPPRRKRPADEEGAPVFVPWYQLLFRPKKIKGKPRWWVPLLYMTAVSAAGLFIYFIFKFLLQR